MEIEPIKGMKVGVNKDAVEPEEYFTILKGSIGVLTESELDQQLHMVASEIISARKNGQTTLADKLEFYAEAMIRERAAIKMGYDQFVSRSALEKNIDKVTPRNGVKLIELERYQRFIPERAGEKIRSARELGLFDDYLILFTDLTGKDYASPEEKKFVARNRDPICFGYFKKTTKAGDRGKDFVAETFSRLYVVADWADDFCDLTWDRLITELPEGSTGQLSLSDTSKIINRISRKKRTTWIGKLISLWKR